MTLYKVLNTLFDKYRNIALNNIENELVYRENLGRMRMCSEIMKILSHKALLTDVELKTEVLLKGE